jgi:hypothetical protein
MKALRRCSLFALAGVCLLMASCVDSKEPISDPQKAKVDPALSGVWRITDTNGNVVYYHIGRAGGKLPEGFLRTITASHEKNGALSGPGKLFAFSSEIGKSRFINLPIVAGENFDKLEHSGWDAKLAEGYFLAKYEVQGDTLTVWGFDKNAKRQAIEAGKIKGTIEKTKDGGERIYFTDTSENIAALLASPDGEKLFAKEPLRYKRVK